MEETASPARGPWKYYRDSRRTFCIFGGEPDHKYQIAFVEDFDHDPETLRNVRLIAAAPEMLEALLCAADEAHLRTCARLGDEWHAIIKRWRPRIIEVVGHHWPNNQRFPGWEADGMYILVSNLRDAVLAKSRFEKEKTEQ